MFVYHVYTTMRHLALSRALDLLPEESSIKIAQAYRILPHTAPETYLTTYTHSHVERPCEALVRSSIDSQKHFSPCLTIGLLHKHKHRPTVHIYIFVNWRKLANWKNWKTGYMLIFITIVNIGIIMIINITMMIMMVTFIIITITITTTALCTKWFI